MRPAAVFDGTNWLVVWQDFRGTDYDLRGARVASDGSVLDTPSVPVNVAEKDQTEPALARSHDTTLMTFTAPTLPDQAPGVWAATLAPSGSMGAASLLSDDFTSGSDVASDGEAFLVAYLRQSEVVVRKLDTSGAPSTPALHVGAPSAAPGVAWGGHYLVVWNDDHAIRAARVDVNGNLVDTTPILVAESPPLSSFLAHRPAVAFGGGVFLVVFEESYAGSGYAARVTPEGTLLDPSLIQLPGLADNTYLPVVRFDGTDFVVARGLNDGIRILRISPAGVVTGDAGDFAADGLEFQSGVMNLAVACGADALAVFDRKALTAGQPNERVFARLVSPDAPPASPDCSFAPSLVPRGAGGTAGTSGGGGSSGNAGMPAVGGGTGGIGGNSDGTSGNPTSDDEGCGCRTQPSGQITLWPLALLVALGSRRRQRPS